MWSLPRMDFTQTHTRTVVGGQAGFAVPLIVAVTGHRDLVDTELPEIRARVRTFLSELLTEYPERGVIVMSPLAEGADQLVAEEALRLDIPLIVPMPMPRKLYVDDFDSTISRERFEHLCSQAAEIYELPITPDNTAATISEHADDRARQYAQLGIYLCAHCHILLALWDGKKTDQLGGTGQVVRFHHDDVMPGFTPRAAGGSHILSDDESDLIYHIVCARNQPDGQPAKSLQALDYWWYTLDKVKPRSKQIPERNRRVFQHTSDFSRDALTHADRIHDEAYSLLHRKYVAGLPSGVREIDHVFRAADWLAIYFQKRMLFALQATHMLAMLMGLTYIIYSDLLPKRFFLYVFLAFFVLATAIHAFSARQAWHRKYLDYRALAEGLRVQFYWAAAGVTTGKASKFIHDSFLQTQDADLGWIRNVMRVAGTKCDSSTYENPTGLVFALKEWLGDKNSGQLGYFRRKGEERVRRYQRTEHMAKIALWIGGAAIVLFILASAEVGELVRDPVVILMGVMLLLVGVRQSYGFSIADAELIKQYKFMFRIFHNARRRVDAADSDEERRRILRLLGNAALEEHTQWLLMYRYRALDQTEVWKMGG